MALEYEHSEHDLARSPSSAVHDVEESQTVFKFFSVFLKKNLLNDTFSKEPVR